MRGRSSLRSSVALTALLALATSASCSTTPTAGSPPGLTFAPTIIVPKDLVDSIVVFSLQAYIAAPDGGTALSCNPSTGNLSSSVTFLTGVINGGKVDEMSSATGCGAGSKRCFTNVKIPEDTSLAFLVTGYSDSPPTNAIAVGCVVDAITTSTGSIPITMVAIEPKEKCGDTIIEPPETCDPPLAATDGGTSEQCSTSCQTANDLLSSGSGTGPNGSITTTGSPGDKGNPFFLWPAGGNFLAFFSDNSTNAAASEQVSMRVRGSSFAPTDFLGPITLAESIYVPNTTNVFPPIAEMDAHKQPVAVPGPDGVTHVVFAYENTADYAIVLRSLDSQLDPGESTPCGISNGDDGESGSLTSPTAAISTVGGAEVLYIAWQDDSGRIFGRTYTPGASGACGTTGTQSELSAGGSNSHVSVAGTASGWIATWQSGTQIALRPIAGSTGTPGHSALFIEGSGHSGSSPTIAAIASGSNAGNYAVAWSDTFEGGNPTIYAQRYTSGSSLIDMAPAQVSVTSGGGGEVTPFIAASTAEGGSYVVVWVDGGGDQEVRARLLAGSGGSLATPSGSGTGYLVNTIDGMVDDFVVSEVYPATMSTRTRVSPTVAVGGTGFMAFGWADNSSTPPFGIIGRRFPLPTQ
jgi:hypothetical protein